MSDITNQECPLFCGQTLKTDSYDSCDRDSGPWILTQVYCEICQVKGSYRAGEADAMASFLLAGLPKIAALAKEREANRQHIINIEHERQVSENKYRLDCSDIAKVKSQLINAQGRNTDLFAQMEKYRENLAKALKLTSEERRDIRIKKLESELAQEKARRRYDQECCRALGSQRDSLASANKKLSDILADQKERIKQSHEEKYKAQGANQKILNILKQGDVLGYSHVVQSVLKEEVIKSC